MNIHQMPAEVLEATRTLLAAHCAYCLHKIDADDLQERYDRLIKARLEDAKAIRWLEYELAQARGDNG